MSEFIKCDLKKFADAIKPLIKEYHIEENQELDSIVNECYQRLKQENINDESTIQKLIGDLILFITKNQICDEQSIIIGSICEAIGIKVTQIESELIRHQNKFVQQEEINNELKKENDELKKESDELKKKIYEVRDGNESLKDRMDLSECFNYAFDLSQLFVSYYVEPFLKKLDQYKNDYSNWRLFNEKFSNLKREIKDGKQSPIVLQCFVEPLQKELDAININILHLHDLIHERHLLNHRKIRSSDEQKDFIIYLDKYQFSSKFVYRDLTQTMIDLLKHTKLRRYVN